MKNIAIRFIVIVFPAFLLVACGKSGNNGTTSKYLIGFSQCNSAEPWREAMNKQMESEVAKHSEIKLIISDAQQSNAKQVADVENFIVRGVDLLMISPNEAQPLTGIVEKAYDKGIPVIVIDRKILSNKYTCFIGANNEQIGREAGKYAAELLNGKGTIVEISGLKGSTPAIERHNGFMDGIKDYPDIKIIYSQDGAWLREKGRSIMENALQRFEKIDLVYGHNDPMAIGAYLAAQYVGRTKDIYFIGIDGLLGSEGGVQAVADNKLNATFIYPTGGEIAIQTALKILKGENVLKNITLSTIEITPKNAKEYLAEEHK
jgi:ABC-type sugar transport system substrate-binding protein